jgi:hypothetical protein
MVDIELSLDVLRFLRPANLNPFLPFVCRFKVVDEENKTSQSASLEKKWKFTDGEELRDNHESES